MKAGVKKQGTDWRAANVSGKLEERGNPVARARARGRPLKNESWSMSTTLVIVTSRAADGRGIPGTAMRRRKPRKSETNVTYRCFEGAPRGKRAGEIRVPNDRG